MDNTHTSHSQTYNLQNINNSHPTVDSLTLTPLLNLKNQHHASNTNYTSSSLQSALTSNPELNLVPQSLLLQEKPQQLTLGRFKIEALENTQFSSHSKKNKVPSNLYKTLLKEMRNKDTSLAQYHKPKNIIKNTVKSFINFCEDNLEQKHILLIMEGKRITGINPSHKIVKKKNIKTPMRDYLISTIHHLIPPNILYNNKLVDKISKTPVLREVFVYWLQYIAEYWVYSTSRIDKANLNFYRRALLQIRNSIYTGKSPRFNYRIDSNFIQHEMEPQVPLEFIDSCREVKQIKNAINLFNTESYLFPTKTCWNPVSELCSDKIFEDIQTLQSTTKQQPEMQQIQLFTSQDTNSFNYFSEFVEDQDLLQFYFPSSQEVKTLAQNLGSHQFW